MTPPEPPDRLTCGVEVDEVLDQVSAGRGANYTDHQSTCPHCQAALAEYDRLWTPVRDLAETPVAPPEGLLEAAIARIRNATADPGYAMISGPVGDTRIAARVVVIAARETAQAVAGVRVALSKLLPNADPAAPDRAPVLIETRHPDEGDAPRVVAGVAGRSTAIDITLAADFGVDLPRLGETIRREVAARVQQLTGLDPVAVSVRIDDVFD